MSQGDAQCVALFVTTGSDLFAEHLSATGEALNAINQPGEWPPLVVDGVDVPVKTA